MRDRLRLIALAGTCLLAGCQSIFGGNSLTHVKMQGEERLDAHGFAQAQLALGRQALAQQQYGQALVAFRNAQLEPEFAASAHNGMAIAYSALGRLDLTERFFNLAVSEAPADVRFQENLAHFHDRVRLAEIRNNAVEAPLADAAGATNADQTAARSVVRLASSGAVIRIELPPPRPQTAVRPSAGAVRATNANRVIARPAVRMASSGAVIRIELPPARMQRVSATEVHIATSAVPARRPTSRSRALAQADGYPVRISIQTP